MTRHIVQAAREDGGQTVVLLAISMPLLLGLLLLVIDGGRLYVERERLLAAARLSAQAGASAFGEPGPSQGSMTDAGIRAVVSDAIARNLPGERVRSTIGVDRTRERVDVRLEKDVDAFFGRLRVPVAGSFSARSSEGSSTIAAPSSQATAAPAPTPFLVVTPKPPCYRTQVVPLFLPPGFVASTISIDGAVAPDGVFFAAQSSLHRYAINAAAAGQRTLEGTLTLQGQAISASSPLYGNDFAIIGRYNSTWGSYPQCP